MTAFLHTGGAKKY